MKHASWHAQEFNKGLFDYLIATDDVHSASHDRDADENGDHPEGSRTEGAAAATEGGGADSEAAASGKGQKKGKKRKQRTERDEEFGVTR